MTPTGIEPATFRFVAQHLNHCATAVPSLVVCIEFFGNPVRHSLALMMEATDFPQASIHNHQTTRRHIPEGSTSS